MDVRSLRSVLFAVTFAAGFESALASDLALAELFTDHMVFAEGKPMRVFGTGTGQVKATFDGQVASAQSVDDKWCVTLPAHAAGSGYSLTVELGAKKVELADVGVGEVFLMSGQSNMQFVLGRSSYPASDYTDQPLLRCFVVTRLEGDKDPSVEAPPFHSSDGWQTCLKDSAQRWSALAYLVGLERVKDRRIPVGMVVCAQGASCISSWLPAELTGDISDADMYGDYNMYAWNRPRGQAYENMFRKIVPFSFSRVMWYQGESDTGNGGKSYYANTLQKLIALWRNDLQDDDLPFSIVQIANLDNRRDQNWSGVQNQQALAASQCSGVTLVPSSDISTSYDIHPVDKTRLAKRMAYVMWKPTPLPEGSEGGETLIDTMVAPFAASAADVLLDTVIMSFDWSPWPGIRINSGPMIGTFLVVK